MGSGGHDSYCLSLFDPYLFENSNKQGGPIGTPVCVCVLGRCMITPICQANPPSLNVR